MNLISQLNIAFMVYALSCPTPETINKSKLDWTTHDNKVLTDNLKSCKRWYTKDHCMVKFIKLDYRTYRIICKKPESK
jgi:hypothetical protein